jgi:uncharacterized integral membrane protein (TIGR00698 family)
VLSTALVPFLWCTQQVLRTATAVGVLLALLPTVSAGAALVTGIAVALTVGNPFPDRTPAISRRMLTWSVVGLGAGIDLGIIGRVGLHGLGYTAAGIVGAFAIGGLGRRLLHLDGDISLLITVGTAICGGSAIAAVGPVIRAKDHDVSLALITIFLLNAVALFLFPVIGHHLQLSADAFGLWCALAIHDTSSVVGAAAQYGPHALEVATAAKLARALWIIPVSIGIAVHRGHPVDPAASSAARPKRPWFIAGFVAVSAVVTLAPSLRDFGHIVYVLARHMLAATLFVMGLGLSRPVVRVVGARPFLYATGMWLTLAATTLYAILEGWIR